MKRKKLLFSSAIVLAGLSIGTLSAFAADENIMTGIYASTLKIYKSGANTVVEFKPALINYPGTTNLVPFYTLDGGNTLTSFGAGQNATNPAETYKRYIYTKNFGTQNVDSISANVGQSSSEATSMNISFAQSTDLEVSALTLVEGPKPSKTNDDDSDVTNDKALLLVGVNIKDGRTGVGGDTFFFKYKNKQGTFSAVGNGPTCSKGQAIDYNDVLFIPCNQVGTSTEIVLYGKATGAAERQIGDALTVDLSSICMTQSSSSSASPEDCSDGIDNDDNGAIDCADSACSTSPFCTQSSSSVSTEYDCTDGIDNDTNGYADCDDYACSTDSSCMTSSSSSSTPSYEESCTDTIDNDSNGYADCDDSYCSADPACMSSSSSSSIPYYEESCIDNIDNDSNGYTDCNDSYCSADPACMSSSSSSSY